MNLIEIDNSSKYEEYERLLFEKQALIKEAIHIKTDYIHYFGDLLNEIFKNQIEVIKFKKIISFCILKQNLGLDIDKLELDNYLDLELKSYYVELEKMVKEKSLIDEDYKKSNLPDEVIKEIKSIYYKIAKLLHPDLHPDDFNENMQELWEKACLYYECNDLESLKEIYDSTLLYVNGIEDIIYEIPNIDDKINGLKESIEKIVTSIPYTYKYDLIDSKAIKQKKLELENENNNLLLYIEELKMIVEDFNIKNTVI